MASPTLLGLDENGIVRVVYSGLINAKEIETHLRRLADLQMFALPTIVDARSVVFTFSAVEARWLSALVGELRRTHGQGIIAHVVAERNSFFLYMHQFNAQATDPEFALFRTTEEAEQWVFQQLRQKQKHG